MKNRILAAFVVLALAAPACALADETAALGGAAQASGMAAAPQVMDMVKSSEDAAEKEATGTAVVPGIPASAVGIALLPVSVPANLLAVPYRGFMVGWDATSKIKSDAGRTAVRIAAAPLLIPAAILNLPSFLLSPTGVTQGY